MICEPNVSEKVSLLQYKANDTQERNFLASVMLRFKVYLTYWEDLKIKIN